MVGNVTRATIISDRKIDGLCATLARTDLLQEPVEAGDCSRERTLLP
ncbi:hypothetical protein T261_01466 [Streptomyces lydicus]|nr:hypothetical protein T261_01466 [Streptomyces lydicus]